MKRELIPKAIIRIVAEKKLRNGPSKGRRQWEVLKGFDGRCVEEFFEHAQKASESTPDGSFQTGQWWKREIDWNLSHGNIEVSLPNTQGDPLPDTERIATVHRELAEHKPRSKDSGLYIVTLRNDEPISAQADDLRAAERAIKVNRTNCKFGKAKSLRTRKRNYEKTFGAENVVFIPIALLDDIDVAEKLVLYRLTDHQARGPSGRRTEWLERIDPSEVASIAFAVLDETGVPHRRLVNNIGRVG